ncbi:MAG: heavy-metal-associated domain-containing protein [Actinobacteria bacterium]|nr:heavy-metal-associated domain-containing protein [Actinomycetota bacterium]
MATTSRTYRVVGMSCEHCVASVTEEVSELPGVAAVEVDLGSGLLTVSAEDIDEAAVRTAVEEAGYEVSP